MTLAAMTAAASQLDNAAPDDVEITDSSAAAEYIADGCLVDGPLGREWPEPAESLPPPYDNRLAQPYGGYISPGSTIDELRIFVSQWDTRARQNGPYRVIQFAVNPFKPWSDP